MMTEIEIWRTASLMLWWYGATAQTESARRADEFAADGDRVKAQGVDDYPRDISGRGDRKWRGREEPGSPERSQQAH